MKKVYLIHGWGGSSSSEGWFSWLKKELSKRNFKLVIFDMPNADEPKIEEWVGFLKQNIKDIDDETYFIGHSIGCQGVLRYLEILKPEIRVGGCVLIAPWMELDKNTIEEEGEEVMDIAKPWMETPIYFDKVRKHTKNFLCIFSDNDPYVPLKEIKKFKKELNARVVIKNNEEPFNDTEKIPEILGFLR